MYQQHISKTHLKHVSKGNNVVNLMFVSLLFTIVDCIKRCQASVCTVTQERMMMVIASLYFMMFASFLAWSTIHVYKLRSLLIDDHYYCASLTNGFVCAWLQMHKKGNACRADANVTAEGEKMDANIFKFKEVLHCRKTNFALVYGFQSPNLL